jgi:hypothetical protein
MLSFISGGTPPSPPPFFGIQVIISYHTWANELKQIGIIGVSPLYSGTLRHGSTILRKSAVSAHEHHLHLICISLTRVHVLALHMFCIER